MGLNSIIVAGQRIGTGGEQLSKYRSVRGRKPSTLYALASDTREHKETSDFFPFYSPEMEIRYTDDALYMHNACFPALM